MPDLHFPQATRAHAERRHALAPAADDAFRAFSKAVFAEGALDARTKQIIAVAVAHVTQCPWCIEGHVRAARRAGATPEQIMEAIWVAAEMRAGAAFAHSIKALDLMEDDPRVMTDGLYPALRTPLCDLLGCDVPILLAGMGGVSRWELAAAVAKAGGYPTLGMVREAPELIAREVQALRAATDRSFAVNLIPAATDPDLLDAQIACCLDLGVGAFSFFWDVVPSAVERVKAAGCLVLHQAGTVQAARDAEAAGADVLIAQGVEAGGHVHGRIGAFALTAEILSGSRVPVVVSGGIVDGRGLAAALAMGAVGVHCGTAFLATTESFAHDRHKRRLAAAPAADTVLTDVFVLNWPRGAAVRVLANTVTEALGDRLLGHDPDALPREPIAWDDGVPRLRFSTDSPLRTTTGDLEAMALYAGQGVGRITDVVPAGERLRLMADEATVLLGRFRSDGCGHEEARHGGE